jgi:hypothetical protein
MWILGGASPLTCKQSLKLTEKFLKLEKSLKLTVKRPVLDPPLTV